jgi:hypothetical protein
VKWDQSVHQDHQETKDNNEKLERKVLLGQKEEQVNKEVLVLLVQKETQYKN